ncbi:MAG: hypothetical protein ACKPKO_52870, partial [Candidatus Fonsibacter sp.]
GITKAMVGLGNVDNTSDANKPVPTAVQIALSGKQDALSSSKNVTVGNLSANICTCGRGVYLGLDSASAGGIEICADTLQYIDVCTPASDYRARILYDNSSSELRFSD